MAESCWATWCCFLRAVRATSGGNCREIVRSLLQCPGPSFCSKALVYEIKKFHISHIKRSWNLSSIKLFIWSLFLTSYLKFQPLFVKEPEELCTDRQIPVDISFQLSAVKNAMKPFHRHIKPTVNNVYHYRICDVWWVREGLEKGSFIVALVFRGSLSRRAGRMEGGSLYRKSYNETTTVALYLQA